MTRARALKQVIRDRAAKTGERYTTARRHVLEHLRLADTAAARPPSTPAPPRAAGAASSKSVVSDAKSREKTGHGLDYWFDVLDRFGGVEKGHTATARHLYETHRVDGWYAQGITLAYERARGVRAPNQRYDGEYEVSVSKVVTGDTAAVIKAFTNPRLRRRWLEDADPHLMKALSAAVDSPSSKGFVVRADGLGRYRYKWDGTIVQLYLVPKAGGKVSLVRDQREPCRRRYGGGASYPVAQGSKRAGRAARWLVALGARGVTTSPSLLPWVFELSGLVPDYTRGPAYGWA